jgi:tetratricopeptide (TPR) repeat protein
MPKSARVLRFPGSLRRREDPLPTEAAVAFADAYLSVPEADRQRDGVTGKPEVLFAICRLLCDRRDESPSSVAIEAAALFSQVRDSKEAVGLFDEKDYLLGELALITAGADRLLGKWADAERWLSRAESSFRHVLNPSGKLAQVGYLRLALKFDQRQFEEVLELTPSLLTSFERVDMQREYCKTEFLKAMCLKGLGKEEEAFAIFDELSGRVDPILDSQLLGQTLIEAGAFHAAQRHYDLALETFNRALVQLRQGSRPVFLAHLKATVAETLLLQGKSGAGIEAYREAISDYVALGVVTQAAYLRLLLADELMQADRPREAEWEILAALPTIEEQKMVPEGFAAVALLKESVRRRKTDPNALRELREHLQASK